MITHGKALNIIEASFEEYIYLLEHTGLSTEVIKKWKNEMRNYITQNEQRDRDVARYFELENKHCELHEIDEFYELREKLSKVGKEE